MEELIKQAYEKYRKSQLYLDNIQLMAYVTVAPNLKKKINFDEFIGKPKIEIPKEQLEKEKEDLEKELQLITMCKV